MDRISASLVLFNTENDILEESIKSFLDSTVSGDLWIVDNSENLRYRYLNGFHERVTYIGSDKNLGYGRAHNIAIRNFIDKTEFHIVLNPDISFESDVVEKLVGFMDLNKNTGLIAPKAMNSDGSRQSNGRLIPSPFHLIMRRFFAIDKFKLQVNSEYELKNNSISNYLSPVILGSFMLFRNSSLKEVGLFDERFFLYPEDIDISRRMFQKFDNVIFTDSMFIHHHKQESYKSFKLLLVHIKEMVKYFNKWGWFYDSIRKSSNGRALKSL